MGLFNVQQAFKLLLSVFIWLAKAFSVPTWLQYAKKALITPLVTSVHLTPRPVPLKPKS